MRAALLNKMDASYWSPSLAASGARLVFPFCRLEQHEQPEPDVTYQDQRHRSDVPSEYQAQD
jgi:hypothetical protein